MKLQVWIRREICAGELSRPKVVPIHLRFPDLGNRVDAQCTSGHNQFAEFAPGLKSLADAVAIRNRILQAFEQAEAEEDPAGTGICSHLFSWGPDLQAWRWRARLLC